MKIRTRLTLWYAAIFSVSLLVIGIATYSNLVLEARARAAHRHHHHAKEVDRDAGTDITQIILFGGGTGIVVGLLGGWWLTRRAFAPVTRLTQAAEKISAANLNEKLPRSGSGDELDRLTEVFNAMTTRLDGSFQRIREFTLHASHELKTPLTILHSELETELSQTDLSPEQHDRLANQLDEIQRLSKIVDGLTLLTKADTGQVSLSLETFALDEIVRDAFEDAQTLAKPHGIQVELAGCQKISVRGDRHRLRQLLLNLADNAVKYNQPRGKIRMDLRREGRFARFTISNTGAGIPPEKLSRVFDRFFRGDASHNVAVDGCGLGLSIARWIVSAHGGTIQIESIPAERTTVTVQLPVGARPVGKDNPPSAAR